MLTIDDVREILADVECEPYIFRVMKVGTSIQRREYDTAFCLQAQLVRPDTETGAVNIGSGGKYYVSPHSTREEVVQKALGACLAYANHEVREAFKWRGRRIFGPHMNHDRLWEIAEETVKRKGD